VNLAHLVRDAAAIRGSHPAFVFEGLTLTYADLERLSGQFAAALAAEGVRPGQVIALLLESGPEILISCLGAFRAGVVPNVVNAMLRPEEVRNVVADSGASLLVTDAGRWEGLGSAREGLGVRRTILAQDFQALLDAAPGEGPCLDLPPDTLACLMYTSGTTGRPKGVMLSHRNILDNAEHFSRTHYRPDDRVLVPAPLFHAWGLMSGLIAIFRAGATAHVMRRFKPEPLLDLLESERATVLLAVPTMVGHLARSPSIGSRSLSSLRVVLCAAAPMPLELIRTLTQAWKVGYAESYGLTETSPVLTTTTAEEMRPGACGKAMGDTELKVVGADGKTLPPGEVGELWARGTAVSLGYYGNPEATREVFVEDGWFRTGDIVRMDEDGYVYIVDRSKDMINVGGEKCYPRDVEEVLFRHPAVADAVVVGMPDEVLGEVVKAVVALKPGCTLTAPEVVEFLRPSLATFKLPRSVEFVESVPRSPSGKALRRLLR
jgi:long-chain acyl-CoA synthetase